MSQKSREDAKTKGAQGITLTKAQEVEARTMVQAGRALCYEKFPYLSTPLSSMIIVERIGLGTVATDARWRMYYDPIRVLGIGNGFDKPQTVDEIISDWVHEVGHLLRDHMPRWTEMKQAPNLHTYWNVSGDALINADNKDMGLVILDGDVMFEKFPAEAGIERNMSTEEIYTRLVEWAKDQVTNCPKHGQGQSGQQSEESQDGQGQSGQQPEESQDGQAQDADSGAPCTCGMDSKPGDGQGGGMGLPNPFGGRDCGSGTGGDQREWEDDISDNAQDGSVDSGRGDLIKAETAQKILDHEKSNGRGTVPGGLSRWANEFLNPVVNWRKELRSVVSRELGLLAGRKDYSYMRPSRRRVPGFIMPGMINSAPPCVAVVLDTSGSMGSAQIEQAVGDVSGLLRAVSGANAPMKLIACDAAAAQAQSVKTARNISLVGGGGTDMRIGIKAAAELKPRPDIIITMTDGYTPWPSEPDPSAPNAVYVAMILDGDEREVPDFMKKIVIHNGERVDD